MGEKLVFLKREEIRTMAKDLARLQEEEAIKEKEKISKLKFEEKLKKESSQREEIIKTMIPGETEIVETREDMATEEISSRISKTPSWKKVLVRIMIVLSFFAFLFLIGFTYWYFAVKKGRSPQPSPESQTLSVSISPSPSPESPTPSPTESINPEIPPIPVISVKEIKIIDLNQEENVQKQLKQAIGNIVITGNEPEFFEILLKKNDQFLGMKDLFEGLELKSPENLFGSVSDKIEDFDFFIYAKNGINQGFGLVVKAKEKESLLSLLNAWEQTMPSDLSNLFITMNKQATLASATSAVFKQANYADAAFRYLSFKEPGVGVCWSVYKDYLVITSSGEIITKTFDLIKAIQ